MKTFFGLLVGLIAAIIIADRYQPGLGAMLIDQAKALIDHAGPGTSDRIIKEAAAIVDDIEPGASEKLVDGTKQLIAKVQGLLPAPASSSAPGPSPNPPAAAPPARIVPVSDTVDWSVNYEVDEDNPISDRKIWVARFTHNVPDGKKIQVKATCDGPSTLTLEFGSYTDTGDGWGFEYSEGDNDSSLGFIYRVDGGDQLLVINSLSQLRYENVAQVVFTRVGPDYTPPSIDQANAEASRVQRDSNAFGQLLVGALQGSALILEARLPQNIIPVLNGRIVRFQLPLNGGRKEIVSFYPGEPAFRQFLARCGVLR